MSKPDVAVLFRTSPVILLSGPIETRLAHEFGRPSPNNASFVQLLDPAGRAALATIYESYLRVALDHGLPIVVDTPTWRAHPAGLARQGLDPDRDLRRINTDAVALLRAIRARLGGEDRIVIAGVVGPRGDGYDPSGAPDVQVAQAYHRPQVGALADAGIDMFYAPTVPAADELEGMASAFAETALPYILAPVIEPDGRMPDGTPLDVVVGRIDDRIASPPVMFAGGCVHPADFTAAVAARPVAVQHRLRGIAANGSPRSHAALERLDHDESDPPPVFGAALDALHRDGLQLIGGCCGTSDVHLRAFAARITAPERS